MSTSLDKRSEIVLMKVDVTDIDHCMEFIVSNKGVSKYICVSNVHMCMEVFDDHDFYCIVNNADLVIPDGRPIFWAQRLLGFESAQQVRGQDIMMRSCEISGKENLNIGLYGGSSQKLLDEVCTKLEETFPDVRIAYKFSPPFRPLSNEEDAKVCGDIRAANIDVLFVGIGCPKQECWMAEHKGRVDCIMLGVGAAYDFIAGSKKHAPRWMQKIGLEWLFRLVSEPSRLWKRYLKQNPRFIYHFSRQLLLGVRFNK